MSNYIYTNDGKLHNADELVHAKYIKRVPNGKGGYRYYYDYNDGDGWSNKVGVEITKGKGRASVSAFNTKADRYWRKHQKAKTTKHGPLTVERAEDGTTATLNINTKKIKATAKQAVTKGKAAVKYTAKKAGEANKNLESWVEEQKKKAKARKKKSR